MNGYYERQYSADDLQMMADMNTHDGMMAMLGPTGMDGSGIVGGQTLDEIISQNNEIQRRRSYNQMQSYGSSQASQEQDPRRASMLEFGSGSSSDLDGFQFDPTPNHPSSMHRSGNIAQQRINGQSAGRRQSAENLALNTHFQSLTSSYSPIAASSPFRQSLNPSENIGLDISGSFMPNNMLMGMDYTAGGLDHENNGDVTPMTMFAQSNFAPNVTSSPLQQNISNSMRGSGQDPGGGHLNGLGEQEEIEKLPNMQMSDQMQNLQVGLSPSAMANRCSAANGPTQGLAGFVQPSKPPPSADPDVPSMTNGAPFSSGENGKEGAGVTVMPQYRNAYSSSGFDMLGVLMRVATRPKPQINIGAVDMSCAFVVCDVTQHDLPIVYCSDIFERLTGYTKHEILGRNCRFLQAPDGKIQAGVRRKYVDDQSVLSIKNMITQRQEAQISLINYRKGGQPFMNLLTMIPITWDSDEVKYYVGFQVDLVEQPTSITNKNPGELGRLRAFVLVRFILIAL